MYCISKNLGTISNICYKWTNVEPSDSISVFKGFIFWFERLIFRGLRAPSWMLVLLPGTLKSSYLGCSFPFRGKWSWLGVISSPLSWVCSSLLSRNCSFHLRINQPKWRGRGLFIEKAPLSTLGKALTLTFFGTSGWALIWLGLI